MHYDDQGLTGTLMDNRKGFQRLVGEVGLVNVGIMLGLEVSTCSWQMPG